jgi:Na+/citrate or Na+/malate symporter
MEQIQDIILGAALIILFIACLYMYLKAVIDIHKRKFPTLREKSMWLTLVIAAPLLGSIFYFAIKRNRRAAQAISV